MGKKKDKKKKRQGLVRDKQVLYEASVQSVDADIDFFKRVYKRHRGRPFRLLREDFCGSAALACRWVERGRNNHSIGLDIHRPTLDWAARKRFSRMGAAAERVQLLERDVRSVTEPAVDVAVALNFSYWVFKDRAVLLDYFKQVRASLDGEGLFFLDVYGGTESMETIEEDRKVKGEETIEGTSIPTFTYIWEQATFNPIDHHIRCHISFELKDGTRIKRAFSYDWRLWTLPELGELLAEAGFARSEVYLDGWDNESNESDGIYRLRRHFPNQAGWVAYIVGIC